MTLRRSAAVVGVAELAPTRWTEGETVLGLLARVGTRAVADAGLRLEDIDGLIVPPIGGISMLLPAIVAEEIGVRPSFAELVDLGGASGAGMVWRAAAAIAAGMCTTCLCVTAATRNRRRRPASDAGTQSRQQLPIRDRSPAAEFEAPYGAVGANYAYALMAMRYHHEFGVTDEQRARVAVAERANASRHPDAVFGGSRSRWPMCLPPT